MHYDKRELHLSLYTTLARRALHTHTSSTNLQEIIIKTKYYFIILQDKTLSFLLYEYCDIKASIEYSWSY